MKPMLTLRSLPDAVPRGHFKAVKLTSSEEPTFISFDLETADLIRGRLMPHPTQIAAVDLQSGREFNTYVLPKAPLTAQQITGIVVNGSGSMTVNGTQVQPATIHSAIIKFCEWLEQFHPVFLVAHNGNFGEGTFILDTDAAVLSQDQHGEEQVVSMCKQKVGASSNVVPCNEI
ncbi:uncharacterized protein LOC110441356 [Mizuhopecten yessoensis]|uniref:uncharacterized protein LOC110441356 n=1 Tax=Mizuhopecten yessoensis TaxID=6573 RepID=UPI000B45F558|nr:uncharacterized protein LOC110441356 [Mizuhopecten yessoensis]